MLHVHARYIRKLERDGRIRRRLEVLPGDREIAERRSAGTGLTIPEFSVLLAHTKIAATQEVLASGLPDDPYLRRVLVDYFPTPLRQRYAGRMGDHRLHREIITTAVVNDMVDRSGTTFAVPAQRGDRGVGAGDHRRLAGRQARSSTWPGFWAELEALDGKVESSVQIAALLEGRKLTERAARWLLHFRRPPFDIQATIDYFADGVLTVGHGPAGPAGRPGPGRVRRPARDVRRPRRARPRWPTGWRRWCPPTRRSTSWTSPAAPGARPPEAAAVYFDLADRLQIARLRDMITALPRDDRWTTMARGAIRDDLYAAHAALARDVLTVTEPGTPGRAAGGLGAAQRLRGAPRGPDADRDLGEQRVQRGHAVGGGPGDPDAGGDQQPAGLSAGPVRLGRSGWAGPARGEPRRHVHEAICTCAPAPGDCTSRCTGQLHRSVCCGT